MCLIKMAWAEDVAANLPGASAVTAPSAIQPSLDHWRVIPSRGSVHKSTEKAEGRGELAQRQLIE